MNFWGRWIPMQVMDTIVLLWVIVSLMAVAAIFWFRRSGGAVQAGESASRATARNKRNKRKKR